jgi:hypothetical protein
LLLIWVISNSIRKYHAKLEVLWKNKACITQY